MDPRRPSSDIVNRLVAGIKEKTVRLAESKLGKSVSESPEEAILGFVGSAIVSGAQRLLVRVQANDLVLTHDGRALTMAEVCMLHRGASDRQHLSRAFRLHLGNKKEEGKITLHYISPTGMHEALFVGMAEPKIGEADLGDLKLAKMTTRIILKGAGNYRRVNQAMGNELPEVNLIRRRCFLAPIDLQIAGRPLDRFNHLPESMVTGVNFQTETHRALSNLSMSPSQGTQVDLSELAPRMKTITAGVCGVVRNAADAGWFRVVDGVARPLSELAWPSRTWGFVALREDADLGLLEREVESLTSKLTIELFERLESMSADRAEEALGYLEQHREVLSEAGHRSVDQDRAFLKLRETILPSSDPKVMNSRLDLAGSLEADGLDEEASRIYAEIMPVWESEALNHFDKYRFEEGAAVWQRAIALHEKIGTEPEQIADKLLKLAEIGREQRLGFAEQSFRRAIRILRSLDPPDPKKLYAASLGLAQVLKKNRVLTEALQYAEQAQSMQVEICGGKETRELVPVLKLQSEIHDLLGDYMRSTDFSQKALLLKFKR